MNYQNKYLKYKNKYLNFKKLIGGFDNVRETLEILKASEVKENINKGTYTDNKAYHDEFQKTLDIRMPLCSFDDKDRDNFILINNENYILIKKINDNNYELFQLNNRFDINKINKHQNVIEDNIIIPGINNEIYGIHLIQAYQYHSNNIFRKFVSNVWTSGYDFFNRLKDIIYKNLPDKDTKQLTGQIVYQNQINIVLSLIFMNKLDLLLYEINWIDNLNETKHGKHFAPIELQVMVQHTPEKKEKETITTEKQTVQKEKGKKVSKSQENNTLTPEQQKQKIIQQQIIKNFNEKKEIKIHVLHEYIHAYTNEPKLNNTENFKNLVNDLNYNLSCIPQLKFEEQKAEFNLLMTIVEKIYRYIEEQPDLVYQYNYSLYIDKYKSFKFNKGKDTPYKSLITFVRDYTLCYIKNNLILTLSSLIYLCHKTNIELGKEYKTAQYMILDYFYGSCRVKNYCVPINKRQILITMLGLTDDKVLNDTKITDDFENKFYELFKQPFKEIKQYTFPGRYTDCGETAILNVFNYFLINEDVVGTFNLTHTEKWDNKLKEFYNKYQTMEKMIDVPIATLKTDLAVVFNNRGDSFKYYDGGDIDTSADNMIKTCAFLLGIKSIDFKPIDFKQIFKELNSSINDEHVIINGYDIIYNDLFTLRLQDGHSEFSLNINLDKEKGNKFNHNFNLKNHWINLWEPDMFPLNAIIAPKYSSDHFIYQSKNNGTGNFFLKFSKDKRTKEICELAFNYNTSNFSYIPSEYQNRSMIDTILFDTSINVSVLEKANPDLITTELYEYAVKKDHKFLFYFKNKQTKNIINIIISKVADLQVGKNNYFIINDIIQASYHLNVDLFDEKLSKKAVNTNVRFFKKIPKEHQTQEMIDAIIATMDNLKSNKDQYKDQYTYAFYTTCMKEIVELLSCVREDLVSKELYKKALGYCITFLKHIPKEEQDASIIDFMKTTDFPDQIVSMLYYLNDELHTSVTRDIKLVKIILTHDVSFLQKIPKEIQDKEMIDIIIKNFKQKYYKHNFNILANIINIVREDLLTKELYNKFCEIDIEILPYIPQDMQDISIINNIISNVRNINLDLKNPSFFEKKEYFHGDPIKGKKQDIINMNKDKKNMIYLFKFVNKKLFNSELCREAFNADIAFFEWIPDEFKNQEMENNLQLNITNLQIEIEKITNEYNDDDNKNKVSNLQHELKSLHDFISFYKKPNR